MRTGSGAGGRGAGGKAGLGGRTSSGAGGSSGQGGDAGSCRRVISMLLASGDAGRYSSMGSSGGLSGGLSGGSNGRFSGNAKGGSTSRGSLDRGGLGGSSSGGTRGRRRRNNGRCTSRSSAGALGALGHVELLGLGEDASVTLGGGEEVDLEAMSASNVLV